MSDAHADLVALVSDAMRDWVYEQRDIDLYELAKIAVKIVLAHSGSKGTQ